MLPEGRHVAGTRAVIAWVLSNDLATCFLDHAPMPLRVREATFDHAATVREACIEDANSWLQANIRHNAVVPGLHLRNHTRGLALPVEEQGHVLNPAHEARRCR